jgi:hypothetical protein
MTFVSKMKPTSEHAIVNLLGKEEQNDTAEKLTGFAIVFIGFPSDAMSEK